MKNVPNVPIDKCAFSVRLRNALKMEGLKTSHDILNVPIDELIGKLSKLPNFGNKSAEELRNWVYVTSPESFTGLRSLLEELANLYDLQAKINSLIVNKRRQIDAINRLNND